ncbi:hypothetical protein [Mycolicibacterium cosmeticum]|uniref:hypothetical protein n=1 Tax=Mycolicibacterium cosmeticum TaxID=258533 RepID=UPI003204A18D
MNTGDLTHYAAQRGILVVLYDCGQKGFRGQIPSAEIQLLNTYYAPASTARVESLYHSKALLNEKLQLRAKQALLKVMNIYRVAQTEHARIFSREELIRIGDSRS